MTGPAVRTATVACALCGRDEPEVRVEKPPYRVVRCRGCRLVYLSPRPVPEETSSIYGQGYFESGAASQSGYASYSRLGQALAGEASQKLAVVRRLTPGGGRLLDHGCGTGVFLSAARGSGYDAVGVDLSGYAVEHVRKRGLPAFATTIESGWGEDESFDAITSWDVLEHVPDPNVTLRHAARLLRRDGYLVATTPDVSGLDARLLGRRWYGYTKVPEHYYFYGRDTLATLLRRAGLEPVSFRRWGFVRDVAFLLEKAAALTRRPTLRQLAERVGSSRVGHVSVTVPLVDMLVIARRVA